jgi:hypothetical protein
VIARIRLINSTDGNTFSLVGTHSDGTEQYLIELEYRWKNLVFLLVPIWLINHSQFLYSFSAQSRIRPWVLSMVDESEIGNLGFYYPKTVSGIR